MDLGLVLHEQGDLLVLHVRGDLEMSSVPAFREAVIDAVDNGFAHLVVDLGTTDFVDSTGLGALIGALKRVKTIGGSLQVVCAQSRLQQLFRLVDLDKVFPIFDSLDEVSQPTASDAGVSSAGGADL